MLHLRMGNVLLAEGPATGRELEIGWHLLHGGDTAHGADLLARAGKMLFESGSFADAIAPLEAAHAAFEALERPLHERLELRCMLTGLGFFSDRRLVDQFARPTLLELRACSGMDAAARIGRFTGKHVGFVLGIGFAEARWLASWMTKLRRPRPGWALRQYLRALVYTTCVATMSYDFPWLDQLLEELLSI